MNIDLGKKIFAKELANLVDQNWQKSFDAKIITFDFGQTEWVSNSEITFLIGWINKLADSGLDVGIQLPKQSGSNDQRKQYFQNKLLLDWKLQNVVRDSVKFYIGGYESRNTNSSSVNEYVELPVFKYETDSFDTIFDELYDSLNLNQFSIKTKVNADLNHLDSDLLNYSILKELFSNVIIHGGLETGSFCQYSFSINRKISDVKANEYLLNQRKNELSTFEKLFFLSKGNYRNIDFVEINFHDFGQGIASTLKSKYLQDKGKGLLEGFFHDEINIHNDTNLDSKILHYAMLLFSSKYEVSRRFQVHDFIPRGLYILQELVAKHQGYLEILSNQGAISISYSNGEKSIKLANKSNKKLIFPGTRVRIVFPSKNSIKSFTQSEKHLKLSKKSDEIFVINLIEHINNAEFKESSSNQEEEQKLSILATFFESINTELASYKLNSIVGINFAGLHREKNDLFIKFLLFITHSPLNTSYRIIFTNTVIRNINSIVRESIDQNKSRGLHIYPIPVVYPDLTIDWIGINDNHFISKLNSLWLVGPNEYDKVFENIMRYESNSIYITKEENAYKFSLDFPIFPELMSSFSTKFSEYILEEIKTTKIRYKNLENSDHDYNSLVRKKEGFVYLTSYGNYQNEYLSFNNKLYMKQYARFMVTQLIFKNYSSETPKPLEKITKILSVTLSSQFLAIAVKEVLIDLFGDAHIQVIALSNYYEFYKEKGFKEIHNKDHVLVINDIISTGRLTETIFDSLEKKGSTPLACFVLADLRSERNRANSIFEELYPVTSLTNYYMERFNNIPEGKKIEWINPILNAPTTLNKERHFINSLMTEEMFLEYVDEDDIIIGNIKNNAYYLTYYLKTDILLGREIAKSSNSLITNLFDKLKEARKNNNTSEISNIINGLEIVKNNISRDNEEIDKIQKSLEAINKKEPSSGYNIDLVCYPFMSNIEQIEAEMDLFRKSSISSTIPEICPIPRVLTEKGWRFTFPPKFLNILTQKSTPRILILDDGSCTGSTIMQMIDSISFLTVKSIDVLSIFGRLEDYQKEFFYRLRSIRTKKRVVPLNVHFGVHMNLPVLTESENPFHQEANEIEALIFEMNTIDDNFKTFLEQTRTQLRKRVNKNNPSSSPLIWKEVSKKSLLRFRNHLGKFDNYRLYSEDIVDSNNFQFWSNDDISIMSLLTVLNLEPYLYKVLKRMVPPSVITSLYSHCKKKLSKTDLTEQQVNDLIKSVYYLDSISFLKSEELYETAIILSRFNHPNSYHYLNLLLLLVAYDIRNIESVSSKRTFLTTCSSFLYELKINKPNLYRQQFRFLEKNIVRLTDKSISDRDQPINYYRKLKNYFSSATINEENHPDKVLEEQLNKLELSAINFSERDPNTKTEFNDKLQWFKSKYYKEEDEYSYIKSIVNNLADYNPKILDFSPTKLSKLISAFELILKNENLGDTEIDRLKELIIEYRTNLLYKISPFNKFIQTPDGFLQPMWEEVETSFKKKSDYIPVKILEPFNSKVEVNRYVLLLTFENIIKNKNQYAPDSEWEIEFNIIDEFRCFLRFKQGAPFISGRTGNGQSEIKSFLEMNDSFYRLEKKKPEYIFRIEMPLKKK